MDIESILAAHRRNALRRIAAAQETENRPGEQVASSEINENRSENKSSREDTSKAQNLIPSNEAPITPSHGMRPPVPLQEMQANAKIPLKQAVKLPSGQNNVASVVSLPEDSVEKITRELMTMTVAPENHALVSDDSSGSVNESDGEMSRLLNYVSTKKGREVRRSISNVGQSQIDEYKTAPLFSSAAMSALHSRTASDDTKSIVFSQYGLLGIYESTGMQEKEAHKIHSDQADDKDRLIFANMDAPWSAFVCGSQGAGKSHTLSCLLENGLVTGPKFNKLPNPLSSVVFHYDKFTGRSRTQLCEAAFLCSAGIPVRILVSPSNIWNMKEMYTNLPGLPRGSPRPKVLPLYLTDKNLNTSIMMKLMCADASGPEPPLYVSVVRKILQEMAMRGYGTGKFSYNEFKRHLENNRWLPGQRGPLNMRLQLLESFLAPSEFTRTDRPAPAKEDIWQFEPGSLTVVDLSDSFIDDSSACALFSICLSIFMESRGKSGQIIALDEAHKFLTQSGEARALTDDLTSIIRQQRHTGSRVVIATQEPTLSPKLMDLANFTIVHRFLSPDWYQSIKRHLAGASKYDGDDDNMLFETIVSLETGEALLFCPTGLLTVRKKQGGKVVGKLGNDYARIRIRTRLTADGGRSIMASDKSTANSNNVTIDVPMFVATKQPPLPQSTPRYPVSTRGTRQPYIPAGRRNYNYVSTTTSSPTQASTSKPATVYTNYRASESKEHIKPGKPTLTEVAGMVRIYVREQFHRRGWQSINGVSWHSLYDAVERSFKLPKHIIEGSEFENCCYYAAVSEISACRKELGWPVMK